MTETRMMAAKTFFARLNEGRREWLTADQLVNGCEEFFKLNNFTSIERNQEFEASLPFTSPIVGSNSQQTIATILRPRLDKYDMNFLGSVESILFAILDNYENSTLALVTDSLSYSHLTGAEDLGVAIENLMDEGMYLLFVNDRSGFALFDEYKKISMPVAVLED